MRVFSASRSLCKPFSYTSDSNYFCSVSISKRFFFTLASYILRYSSFEKIALFFPFKPNSFACCFKSSNVTDKIPLAIKTQYQVTKKKFVLPIILLSTKHYPSHDKIGLSFTKKTVCLDRALKICHSVVANRPPEKTT